MTNNAFVQFPIVCINHVQNGAQHPRQPETGVDIVGTTVFVVFFILASVLDSEPLSRLVLGGCLCRLR